MRTTVLTEDQVKIIVARYDGKSETIDELMREFGCARHNIHAAAKRGGYEAKSRKTWTDTDDQYLRENYGRVSIETMCEVLNCSEMAIRNRKKRIGISTRDFVDLTIHDLQVLTKIDHRLWQRFRCDGWITFWEQPRKNSTPALRISVADLKAFFVAHPEVFNYRAADEDVRAILQLDDLPDPPKYKRITCRSASFESRVVQHSSPGPYGRGSRNAKAIRYNYELTSCEKLGGTDIWAPIYENGTTCPRCGCVISRFSEKVLFSNETPDDGEILNLIAAKIGLAYRNGRFVDAEENLLSEADLLRHVFNSKRNPGDSVSAFRKLLKAGVSIAPPNPVPSHRIGKNILSYELFEGAQKRAFDDFVTYGNIGIYWPPGEGKMFFGAMLMTRISGTHVVFANTTTIIEQWLMHLKKYAPSVKVSKKWKPSHQVAEVRDQAGQLISTIEFFNYATSFDFESKKYVIAEFDEAHFLPGNNAHRLVTIDCEYRVGLTATPFREDGRADLIQTMTGYSIGEDWKQFADAGTMQFVPVTVLIVENFEDKFEALPSLIKGKKTLVFVEMLEDGSRVASRLNVPFVSSLTNDRLSILNANPVTVVSRVGDCGIDLPDLEEVIELGFHRGSRAQSLQRLGRLLHSDKPLQHTVMMTREEFTRYYKRLSAMEQKGFSISISLYEPQEPIFETGPLQSDPWLRTLGFEKRSPVKIISTTPVRRYVDGKLVAA